MIAITENKIISDLTKQLVAARLKDALEKEALSNKEAGEILGVMPQYLSMMKNPNFWKNVSKRNWKILNDWRSSGVPLRNYNSNLVSSEPAPEHPIEPVIEAPNEIESEVDLQLDEEQSETKQQSSIKDLLLNSQKPIEKDEEVLALMIENEELRRELDFYKSEIKDLKVLLANFRNENYEAKNTILTEMKRYNTLVLDLLNKQKPVNVIVQSGSQA